MSVPTPIHKDMAEQVLLGAMLQDAETLDKVTSSWNWVVKITHHPCLFFKTLTTSGRLPKAKASSAVRSFAGDVFGFSTMLLFVLSKVRLRPGTVRSERI